MRIEPEQSGAAIVLVGAFNPRILSPDWLFRNGLIKQSEFDLIETGIIHGSIAEFSGPTFKIQATEERFSIITEQPPFDAIFDLARRIFGEMLTHTPITAFGINLHVHYRVPDNKRLTSIGEKLAPKQPWGEWGKFLQDRPAKFETAAPADVVERLAGRMGGLRSLLMEESLRYDGLLGHVLAKVEPSAKFRPGVYVEVNDHYEIDEAARSNAAGAMDLLEKKWPESIPRAEWIVDQVMGV